MNTVSAAWRAFINPRFVAILICGFASGLPLALTGQALQAWLTTDGVDLKTIALFALVGQPYTYKFLWAPLLDRFEPPLLGRRRGWLMSLQVGLALALFFMSALHPAAHLQAFAIVAVVIAFLSASQDVVIDAYRTNIAHSDERGMAASMGVLGYRIAMIASGGISFIMAEHFSWSFTYKVMGFLMLCAAGYTLIAPNIAQEKRKDALREFAAFAMMVVLPVAAFVAVAFSITRMLAHGTIQSAVLLDAMPWVLPMLIALGVAYLLAKVLEKRQFAEGKQVLGFFTLAAAVMCGYFTARLIWMGAGVNVDKPDDKWIELYILLSEIIVGVIAGFFAAILARFELLLVPLRAYFRQEYAMVFLVFIILYKLGDVFAGGLITNFLLETVKFSLSEIGLVNKVFGLLATILGAIVGGYLLKKIGLWRGLLIFGALQAITNLGYWWLALKGKGSLPNWIQFERADWMKVFLSQKAMKSADVIIQIDTGLLLAVFLENFAGGMGTIALVALMMALCSRKESTATQFALLSALSAIGRVYVTPTTPYLIDSWGWAHFFLFSMSAAIPALLMLFWMRRVVGDLDKTKV